jgi:hypothetical protein
MRLSTTVLSLAAASMLGFVLWASGCSDLSEDCELNLNCPPVFVEKPNCGKQVFPGDCDACLQTQCCKEMADCIGNETCLDYCFSYIVPSPTECTDVDGALKDTFGAANQCLKTKCADKCRLADQCNPVTHNGCESDGSSCDITYPGVFACFKPSGNPAQICETCDLHTAPFCGSGLRCHPVAKKCGRYCCNDSDCGTGRCELDPMKAFGYEIPMSNAVGLCMVDDPMFVTPACDAPATPMSDGSCFAGFDGM